MTLLEGRKKDQFALDYISQLAIGGGETSRVGGVAIARWRLSVVGALLQRGFISTTELSCRDLGECQP